MAVATNEQLMTVGQVAERLRARQWRVAYMIDSRGIEPVTRAGNLRLFGPAEVAAIEAAMAQSDTRRGRARSGS